MVKHFIENYFIWILYIQDIKATHIAIEAPIQVLLKLSMISLGILDLPGKQFYYSKERPCPTFYLGKVTLG